MDRAVGRDPEYFPDPESFNPQRWLNADGELKDDMKSFPFGFGRRCVMRTAVALARLSDASFVEYALANIWRLRLCSSTRLWFTGHSISFPIPRTRSTNSPSQNLRIPTPYPSTSFSSYELPILSTLFETSSRSMAYEGHRLISFLSYSRPLLDYLSYYQMNTHCIFITKNNS